jgi:hypothetical protein
MRAIPPSAFFTKWPFKGFFTSPSKIDRSSAIKTKTCNTLNPYNNNSRKKHTGKHMDDEKTKNPS